MDKMQPLVHAYKGPSRSNALAANITAELSKLSNTMLTDWTVSMWQSHHLPQQSPRGCLGGSLRQMVPRRQTLLKLSCAEHTPSYAVHKLRCVGLGAATGSCHGQSNTKGIKH